MAFTVRKLTNPTDAEVETITTCLRRAFGDEGTRATALIVGRDTSLLHLFEYYTVLCGALAGELYVAESPEGEVIGVAEWFPPGRMMYDTPEQHEKALVPLLSKFPVDLKKWWEEEFIPKYHTLTEEFFGAGVKQNSWHLQLMGVVPEWKCKGVGSALIEGVRAKKGDAKMVLETSTESNILFYEANGFISKGDGDFSSPHGSFHTWALQSKD